VLGFDAMADYRAHGWYCGATVGRFAGRIKGARFTLDGREYVLAANNGANHLHGGMRGFDKVSWQVAHADSTMLRLHHTSASGEEGYPGTVNAQVVYTLTDADELIVDHVATSDRPTPINLTHHGYFNLAGAGRGDVLGHELQIDAGHYLPVDAELIPTGELRPVAGTIFDFRTSTRLGERTKDYDHDFVLRAADSEQPRFAARLREPESGRVLEVFTTQPALHIYTGAHISNEPAGKGGAVYGPYAGVALEAQHFPDSPNQPAFPSTILRPGSEYRQRTIYRFSAEAA
jgi:aldose 1-epimerase